jgi:glycine cleavage system aminomethyltransferase T
VSSLEFLSPAPTAIARSPMEREALAAGARIEQRDGWNVAVEFDGVDAESQRLSESVGFVDRSDIGKIEVQSDRLEEVLGEPVELGRATGIEGAWLCPTSRTRALVLCEPASTGELLARFGADAVDLTSAMAAITIAGPLAREVFARFTAIDLRPQVTPVHGFRPGSVARTPGAVLRETDARWLMLFGAALGSYVWTVVADAAGSLGGGPVGARAFEGVPARA